MTLPGDWQPSAGGADLRKAAFPGSNMTYAQRNSHRVRTGLPGLWSNPSIRVMALGLCVKTESFLSAGIRTLPDAEWPCFLLTPASSEMLMASFQLCGRGAQDFGQ